MVTKIKKKKKKLCGEVHRWRGRWVQTLACGKQNNPTELHGLPPVVRMSLDVKAEPEMCFQSCVSKRRKPLLLDNMLDLDCEWGKFVNA